MSVNARLPQLRQRVQLGVEFVWRLPCRHGADRRCGRRRGCSSLFLRYERHVGLSGTGGGVGEHDEIQRDHQRDLAGTGPQQQRRQDQKCAGLPSRSARRQTARASLFQWRRPSEPRRGWQSSGHVVWHRSGRISTGCPRAHRSKFCRSTSSILLWRPRMDASPSVVLPTSRKR